MKVITFAWALLSANFSIFSWFRKVTDFLTHVEFSPILFWGWEWLTKYFRLGWGFEIWNSLNGMLWHSFARKYFFLRVTLTWCWAVVINRLHLYPYFGYFIAFILALVQSNEWHSFKRPSLKCMWACLLRSDFFLVCFREKS